MNATFHFRDQLQARWDNAKQYLADGIDLLGASIAAGFYKEHNQNDTHGTVTADSLTSRAYVYDRSRTVAMGVWQDVMGFAFSQCTASAGTWTLTAITLYRWMRIGNTIFIALNIDSPVSAASAPAAYLRLPLPAGITVKARNAAFAQVSYEGCGQIIDAGGATAALPYVQSEDTFLYVTKASGANIAAGGVGIYISLTFEVEP